MDGRETRNAEAREADLFERLAPHLRQAVAAAPGLARHLEGCDLDVTDRAALARLPVLRKSDLMAAQREDPPFGGFVDEAQLAGSRIFLSPGPIWEPQGQGEDPWQSARALHAAGFREGDRVLNALGYGPTPGGFILDAGARVLGCMVYPAGAGGTEGTVAAIGALRPDGYVGTPDYLKALLDRAREDGVDASSITKALVSGGALFPSMRTEYGERGVAVMQCYATADLGVIAYEVDAEGAQGMVVSEDLIVEIVRPGTGEPVAPGEVGEVVVTTFSSVYPLVRFGTGDLSAEATGTFDDGHTNMRLKGWMGRADQRTKVKGMFVDPAQVAAIVRRTGIAAARLVVTRDGDADAMELRYRGDAEATGVAEALRAETGLRGTARRVDDLPNDGKVIADERDYEA